MELLERTPYLNELSGLLRQAAGGRGNLVLLGGEAGVGKTALVSRFVEQVGDSARVIGVSCDALSTPGPLGPLHDIAPMMNADVQHLLADGGPRDQLFRAVLASLGGAPGTTLVVAEDAHWSDQTTLDHFRFVGRRIGGFRLLMVVTFRDDELGPTHPLRLVLGDLATAPDVHRLRLRPLSEEGVRQLAAGGPVDPGELYRRTGGNPFFVTEVLATNEPGIPATVYDAVLARAARLSPAGRAMLDAAAVIGSPIEPRLLARVVETAAGAVEECIAGGVLCAAGSALSFRHELAREAVLDAIAPPRRQELHARTLAALRARSSQHLARLAHHAEEAGDREAVLAYAPAAAERAAALWAHREAAAQYARALRFADELPSARRADLLIARSRECYLTDQLADAIASCQAALTIWRQLNDTLRAGDGLRWLSRLFWFGGRNAEAEQAARAALDVLEALPPGPQLAMAYSNQAQLLMLAWDNDQAIAWGEKAIALAESLGEIETLIHALNNVGAARFKTGDERGQEQIERSLYLAREAALEDHVARAFTVLGSGYAEMYEFGRADRYLSEGIAYCVEHDLDHLHFYMLAWRAISLFYQGHWAEAAEVAESVVRQRRGSPLSRIMALVALGRVLVRRGDPKAVAILDEALALAAPTGELQRLGPVRTARAERAWLAGDLGQVWAETRDLFDVAVRYQHSWLLGEMAFWLWRAGKRSAAPPGAFEPYALQIAGEWSAAAARWRALGCPYEAAMALADGDEPAMRYAHAEFARLGARPAAAMVARRLRELGASGIPRGPRPASQTNPANLTPRELEILALVAAGCRNAEIAARLYLSPKTVGHHVSAVLAKLEVRARSEVAPAAARLGIPIPAAQDRADFSQT